MSMNKMKFRSISLILILTFVMVSLVPAYGDTTTNTTTNTATNNTTTSGTNYYVSNSGDDNNPGTSESQPWKTLDKVNDMTFQPGDIIHFEKGGMWRGQLFPSSGNENGYVTYTSYGTGEKPKILGSVEKNNEADWIYLGNNIWTLNNSVTEGPELLTNPSFESDINNGWGIYAASGVTVNISRDTVSYDSYPASCKIECITGGTTNAAIQLYTAGISIEKYKSYRLTFRAKCSQAYTMPEVSLAKATSPYTSYMLNYTNLSQDITTEWKEYTINYRTTTDATDARITFKLGTLPSGAVLNIDSVSFVEISDNHLLPDVGNIIFNNGEGFKNSIDKCAYKVFNEADINAENKFWFDEVTGNVKLCSTINPALKYEDIELASTRHIVYGHFRSYFAIDGLSLLYGAAHGVSGLSTDHMIVRNCDISFIGGGLQRKGLRYGNGIQVFENIHDVTIENNKIWDIYDTGVTNQGNATNIQYNIYYRNNVIWNCEYTFEFWNRPNTSVTHHVYFENNTCAWAGGGWAHFQRPPGQYVLGPNARQLYHSQNTAITSEIYFRNNIFYESTESLAILHKVPGTDTSWVNVIDRDYNCWYDSEGMLFDWKGTKYYHEDFAKFQADTGKDAHSIFADPLFVNPQAYDFHLKPDSPCRGMGANIGITSDHDGNARPANSGTSVGAYEYIPYVNVKTDFGAVGDGINNDTEAIQNAINTGKTVYFPTGNYLINNQIRIKNGCKIIGEPGLSKIITNNTFPSLSNDGIFINEHFKSSFDATADSFTIKGMSFEKTYSPGTDRLCILKLANTNGVTIDNCKFLATGNCYTTPIDLYCCNQNVTIQNCDLKNLTGYHMGGVLWVRNLSASSDETNKTYNITINNNTFESTVDDEALACFGRDGIVRKITATNNKFNNYAGSNGLGTAKVITFFGKTAYDVNNQTKSATIEDVTFTGNTINAKDITHSAISVGGSCGNYDFMTNILIADNTFNVETSNTNSFASAIYGFQLGTMTNVRSVNNSVYNTGANNLKFGVYGLNEVRDTYISGSFANSSIESCESAVNNTVENNISSTGIRNCENCENNTISNCNTGIRLYSTTTDYNIKNNTIYMPNDTSAIGIQISSTNPTVTLEGNTINNTVTDGTYSSKAFKIGVGTITMLNNINNGSGKFIDSNVVFQPSSGGNRIDANGFDTLYPGRITDTEVEDSLPIGHITWDSRARIPYTIGWEKIVAGNGEDKWQPIIVSNPNP